MKFHFKKIGFLLFFFISCFVTAQTVDKEGIPIPPQPPKLVNDYAELMTISNRENLENKLLAYNDSTSTQICVVTVNTIGDYEISDYAVRLGRSWGIGQKDKNNGILILVAKNERKVDIEIGYGLESYITDYDSKEIIDAILVPAFKQNHYYQGIDEATTRIIAQLQGTYSAPAKSKSAVDALPDWAFILIMTVIFIIIISIISSGKSTVSIGGGGWTWTSGGGGSSWSGGGSSSSFGGFGGGSFGGGGSSGSW